MGRKNGKLDETVSGNARMGYVRFIETVQISYNIFMEKKQNKTKSLHGKNGHEHTQSRRSTNTSEIYRKSYRQFMVIKLMKSSSCFHIKRESERDRHRGYYGRK